jgi:ParD-like antitoxin of type II ParDE toxin-antitoxin system
MTSRNASIKLSAALVDEARRDAPVFSRSLSGQVEHWARLGQAVESAPGFTLERVRAALDGTFSPSDLEDDEQAIFFELLGKRHSAGADQAAFAAELLQEPGNVGYDGDGNLVKTVGGGKLKIVRSAG